MTVIHVKESEVYRDDYNNKNIPGPATVIITEYPDGGVDVKVTDLWGPIDIIESPGLRAKRSK